MGGVIMAENHTGALRYEDMEQIIRENNKNVQSGTTTILAAKARTGSLLRSFSPLITASLGSEGFYNNGLQESRVQPIGSVDISMNLSRGGQDRQEELIRQAQASLTEANAQKTYTLAVMAAQLLYWDMSYLDEVIRNAQAILKYNVKSYSSAQRRLSRGLLTQSDLLGFEIYKGQLEEAIESAEHEKKILMIKLQTILGVSAPITLQISSLPHTHDETLILMPLSVSGLSTIQELNINKSILKLQQEKLMGKNRPSIDVFAGYTLYTEAERPFSNWIDRAELAAGIRAQFLIYDGNQSQSEMSGYSLQLQSASEFLSYKTQQMAAELKVRQEEMIHLHELFHLSESRFLQTQKFMGQIFEDYDRGVKDSSDVLTAIQLYQHVLEAYAVQRRDYQKIKSELLGLIATNVVEKK